MASDEKPAVPPADDEPEPAESRDDDAVDEMERESFPASDPPSTWAGRPSAGP